MNDAPIFDLLRRFKRRWSGKAVGLTQTEVDEANRALSEARQPSRLAAKPVTPGTALQQASGAVSVGKTGPLALIVGSIAATSLFATVPEDEGYRLKAYFDVAGIATICMGDTKNVRMGMVETPEGCMRRLEAQLIAHAKPVMACSPRLKEPGRDWQTAAAVSLAYNIGVGAYCKSSIDRAFDRGDWRTGCNSILLYNKARVRGKLQPVRGLTLRRQRERALCLKGLA